MSGGRVLALERASRRFGDFVANDAIDLHVGGGEIVGLLGANGAGKTTAMRVLLGLLPPSEGRVRQFGEPPSRATRRRIGYVPQGLGLWDDLTIAENLRFVASSYGVEPAPLDGELGRLQDRLLGSVGLGAQRRVAFAAALGHRPDALVLDEPTSGVDALGRSALWDRIRVVAEEGVGVLVSTHALDEASQCDYLVVLARGCVVATGSETDIVGGTTAVSVHAADWAGAFGALDDAGFTIGLVGTTVRVPGASPSAVAETLRAASLEAEVDEEAATLEETMVVIAAGGAA